MYRLSSVLTSGGVGMSNAFPVASPKSICVRSPFKHGMGSRIEKNTSKRKKKRGKGEARYNPAGEPRDVHRFEEKDKSSFSFLKRN